MGTIKQINIKNGTYSFYLDIINLENFDSSLLKIDKKSYKEIGIYNVGYITIKNIGDYKNIYSVNPLNLRVDHVNEYIEEKIQYVLDGIKNEIKTINGGKEKDYEKDYMKIKFNSDDDLPLNKSLKFHLMTRTIRSVLQEDDKPYPQVFLDDALRDLRT